MSLHYVLQTHILLIDRKLDFGTNNNLNIIHIIFCHKQTYQKIIIFQIVNIGSGVNTTTSGKARGLLKLLKQQEIMQYVHLLAVCIDNIGPPQQSI